MGLADAEGDAEKISEAIKIHLNPIPEFRLSFEKDEDKTFVIVEVMKGQQTPYYYEGDGQLIAFMRIGNESVPATPSQLRELVLRGSGESYDSLKSGYDFGNMSFTKLKSVYKQRTGNTFENTDYESFGLIDENGNLTNAGAILADESPVRHSRLFCTRWNGLTKASGIVDALDDKEYTGSLVTLLQAGTDFVRNNSKKAWRKVDDGRIEMPDYPDRAVLEGVVNALIHRNYMEIGSEVHIDMFDDRIEIYSPGGMVSGISLEGKDLLKIPSKRRNPILADIFSRLKYMERRGSGFKKILADYEGQVEFDESKMPVFDADNDDFTLTLCYFFSEIMREQREEDIYKNQYCIIIDDPVSSFDMENRVGILSFLKHQLNKFISGNPKTKVVLLTHDLQTAYDIEKIYGEITDLCGISPRQADRNKYIKSQELINNAVREFNSSRRNEYTQLMINIYKYAKGENADYELVVGNSMRRVMEAYGSFMYKKGIEQLSTASEIKQKLEPPFGDHFENLMYRLVLHGGSHNEERVKSMVSDDFFDYISSEEKIRTAKEILVFLYTLDDQHVIEHLKRDLNGKTLNDVQTDLETWKQEILSLISLDE